MPRMDELLIAGLGMAADRLGHRELWDAGANKIARVAVKQSLVPTDELSVQQIVQKLGITPDHVDVVDGVMGLLGKLRK